MDNNVILIICAILALITVIVYTFASAAIYKRTRAKNNPYYFCESDWICCSVNDCDASKNLDFSLSKDVNSYNPSGDVELGSNYHQYCVLPVQNGFLNYGKDTAKSNLDFSYLYGNPEGQSGYIPKPSDAVSPYYPGCNTYGSDSELATKITTATEAECTNPKLNPQNPVISGVCPYGSIDAYLGTAAPSSGLPSGAVAYTASTTLQPSNWTNGLNTAYIAGYAQNGTGPGGTYANNGYLNQYNVPGGAVRGQPTANLNRFNTLAPKY